MQPRIIYTRTDEAPLLATHSFLPIVRAFSRAAGVSVETRDISLAGRILAAFPEYLDRPVPDALAELGEMVGCSDANIIKLPNISASVPQIRSAVKELREKGYALPLYPDNPDTEEEQAARTRYDGVKGSAVNPVLREGNSDRRTAPSVKRYARNNPHPMGKWEKDSQTHVASMSDGDFYGSEQSVTAEKVNRFRIEFVDPEGQKTLLRAEAPLEAGEIVDAAVMSRKRLRAFLEMEIKDAKERGLLFSLHLKATMMKVSDPVIFGHAVSVYFRDVFEKHSRIFSELGVDPDQGLGDLEARISALPDAQRSEVEADIQAAFARGPRLAMVDSHKSNFHVPSDIIIDASMPAAIRNGGRMWGPDGEEADTKAVIPDRCYAGVYQAVVEHCKENGAFDPAAMGSVSNVGLMAQKAEEYGSHDKTFLAPGDGVIRALGSSGEVILQQKVEKGDLFRMCQVRDEAVRDWVKLAVKRAGITGAPAVFWLDPARAHDAQIIKKVNAYLPEHDTAGLDISIKRPYDACRHALKRARAGEDTISVTGNVLRDYLTDLFPILELGTSAKMLSIVPLMKGGGLFETGAGGSAPKHVRQLLDENHLRWDSLGEFMALASSFDHLAGVFENRNARILGRTLDEAIGALLENGRSPSRKCGEIDNRGSHYYLALYWASALAKGGEELKDRFTQTASDLAANEERITRELLAVQGDPVDVGGYYLPDAVKADRIMRPCKVFNDIVDSI